MKSPLLLGLCLSAAALVPLGGCTTADADTDEVVAARGLELNIEPQLRAGVPDAPLISFRRDFPQARVVEIEAQAGVTGTPVYKFVFLEQNGDPEQAIYTVGGERVSATTETLRVEPIE